MGAQLAPPEAPWNIKPLRLLGLIGPYGYIWVNGEHVEEDGAIKSVEKLGAPHPPTDIV